MTTTSRTPPARTSFGPFVERDGPTAPTPSESAARLENLRQLSANEWLAMLLILGIAAVLRFHDLDYNTAYTDETINIVVGRSWWAGETGFGGPGIIPWNLGWYLFPVLGAFAETFGGIPSMRAFTGAMGVGTVVCVFLYSRRLFSIEVGLAAALLCAVLSPFVFCSRIAFREDATIFFVALTVVCMGRAWQRESSASWFAAALSFFAAFLCKHPVAIFLPVVFAIPALAGRRGIIACAIPLALMLAGYGLTYVHEMLEMLRILRQVHFLTATRSQLIQIYFVERLDFWTLLLLAGVAPLIATDVKPASGVVRVFWIAAAVMPIVHVLQRADYKTYGHAGYPLLFLMPLGVEAIRRAVVRLRTHTRAPVFALSGMMLAGTLGLAGRGWRPSRADVPSQWPNAELVTTFLAGRLAPSHQLLIDDRAFRYYLWDRLPQSNITDPYSILFNGRSDDSAYRDAVRSGHFDYIALNGADDGDALRLRSAIAPALASHYQLILRTRQPSSNLDIEIYERVNPSPVSVPDSARLLAIKLPVRGAAFETPRDAPITVRGTVRRTPPGAYILLDVFTNRWYKQGEAILPNEISGDFVGTALLGGMGAQRCAHVLRARLFAPDHRLLESAMSYDIVRNSPGGGDPPCSVASDLK